MPLTQEDAQLIATDWVNAWNKKDLEAILRHYDGNVQFRSPRAIASYEKHKVGSKDGLIKGLTDLRDYFAKAIETIGDHLHLMLDQVLLGTPYTFTMIYHRETGSTVVESVEVDPNTGKIIKVQAYYGDVC